MPSHRGHSTAEPMLSLVRENSVSSPPWVSFFRTKNRMEGEEPSEAIRESRAHVGAVVEHPQEGLELLGRHSLIGIEPLGDFPLYRTVPGLVAVVGILVSR